GYGALAIAERRPDLVSVLAVVCPAVWTSYAQAHAANAGAFASASDFAAGADDPFQPGVERLAGVLGSNSTVEFPPGCHTGPFFVEQEPLSLDFLSRHLN